MTKKANTDMNIPIDRASVPTLVRMLENFGRILQKADEFARVEGLDAAALLERRLSPDMFPLSRQVQIVVSGAKGSAARLAGRLDPLDCSPEFAVGSCLVSSRNRGRDPNGRA